MVLRKENDEEGDAATAKQTLYEIALCKNRPKSEHPKVSLMNRPQMEQLFQSQRVGVLNLISGNTDIFEDAA